MTTRRSQLAVRKYELMVILDPARTEDDQKAWLDQVNEVVSKYGGTPDKVDVWGRRRLAYEINRRKDGWYALVYFDTETTGPALAEVDRFCKFDDAVLRHIITSAVTGKSKGTKPAETSGEDRPAYWTGGRFNRGPREGGDRRFRRPVEGAPAEAVAAPVEAEAAPAAAEAPAES
jgi:small subunit ribosomal protein S6